MNKILEILNVENEEQAIEAIENLLAEKSKRVFCVFDNKNVFLSESVSIGHVLVINQVLESLKQDMDNIRPWKRSSL